jgi:hypothetical protein
LARAVGKGQRTFGDAEVLFDEPDNAAEIVPVVVDEPSATSRKRLFARSFI